MTTVFAHNHTSSHLILKTGYLNIPRGKSVRIPRADANTQEFLDVVSKGWVTISETEPGEVVHKTLEAEVPATPIVGMTEEELKADLAASQASPQAEPAFAEPVVAATRQPRARKS